MNFGRAGDGACPSAPKPRASMAIAMRLARRMAKARSGTTSEMVSIGPGRGGAADRAALPRQGASHGLRTPGRG